MESESDLMSANILFLLKIVIIGIVEGITEFLPISSTGHMIIVGNFINFNHQTYGAYADMFDIVIQLGAILAVVVLFWDKIWKSLKNLLPFNNWGFKLWFNILIAFIPAALIGIAFDEKIEKYLFYPIPVAIALVVGGFLMIIMENKFRRRYNTKSIDDVNIVQSAKIGVFQCLSLWPGMSRSASTIMGGWISGLSTVAAAEFSFFLAIPTMVAASGYKLIKTKVPMSGIEIIGLGLGFLVSFGVALLVVEKFINFLKKKPMRVFAVYRIAAGIILLVLAALKVITVAQ